jgi:hypothetical protein
MMVVLARARAIRAVTAVKVVTGTEWRMAELI